MAPDNKTLLRFLRRDVALPNHPTNGDFRREFQNISPLNPDRQNIDKLIQESTPVDVALDNDPEIVSGGEPEQLIGNAGVTVAQHTLPYPSSVIPTSITGDSFIQMKWFSGSAPLDGPFPGELPDLLPLADATQNFKSGKNRQDGDGFIQNADEALRSRYMNFFERNIAPDTVTYQSVSIAERSLLTHSVAKQLADGTFIDINDYMGIVTRANYTLINDVAQVIQIQLFLLYRRNGVTDNPQDRNRFGLLEIRDEAVWTSDDPAVAVVDQGRVSAAGASISSAADITATYLGLTTDPITITVDT